MNSYNSSPIDADSRVNASVQCVTLLQSIHKDEILNNLVTGSENVTVTVLIKCQPNENQRDGTTKKNDSKHEKVTFSVWWGVKGIIHWEIFSSDRRPTAELCCQQLDKVASVLKDRSEQIYLYHENRRACCASLIGEKVLELKWISIGYPSNSPDLAPTTYHLKLFLDNRLKKKKFDSMDNFQSYLSEFFKNISEEFLQHGFKNLLERCKEIIQTASERSSLSCLTPFKSQSLEFPIFDLSLLDDGNYREQLAAQVDEACRKFGAFYVMNSANFLCDTEKNRQDASRLFQLPDCTKNKILSNENDDRLGYNKVNKPEEHEKREWYYMKAERDDRLPKNKWPAEDDIPGWKEATIKNFEILSDIGEHVYKLLSLGLGENENFLKEKYGREPALLQTKYEPGGECPEHYDFGIVAVNLLDPNGGLEIQIRHSDQWIDVPYRENMAFCHIGDGLEKESNYRWYSVIHRVTYPDTKESCRHGVILFNNRK